MIGRNSVLCNWLKIIPPFFAVSIHSEAAARQAGERGTCVFMGGLDPVLDDHAAALINLHSFARLTIPLFPQSAPYYPV
jgi:hypothetical protein